MEKEAQAGNEREEEREGEESERRKQIGEK